eukprot:gnl/MRDRNA2_/MRDRNA2_109299_c0_seq1.p1 gnl/MRDRNA2_/MRDRNA2_109299_c0~~gnl/MRDRNA2_/MRDRNA2_109299_c0_seq1.p1  ORF type:complete len:996 (+),score=183.14 gnl/MRDRNA2_/MRDRNA2_109299_c0_seq1:68-3055(+)
MAESFATVVSNLKRATSPGSENAEIPEDSRKSQIKQIKDPDLIHNQGIKWQTRPSFQEPPSTAPVGSRESVRSLRPIRNLQKGRGGKAAADRGFRFDLSDSVPPGLISPLEFLRMRQGFGAIEEARALWPQQQHTKSVPELMKFFELSNFMASSGSDMAPRPCTVGGESQLTGSYMGSRSRTRTKLLSPLNGKVSLPSQVFPLDTAQFGLKNRIPVRPEHIDCQCLPSPLERLYLLLPRWDLPSREDLDEVGNSPDPKQAFAQLLIGDDARHISRSFDGKVMRFPEPCSALKLAAMTALTSHECEVLVLGPVEDYERSLRMLTLWPKLSSLSYHDPNMKDLSVLNKLTGLVSLELNGMGGTVKNLSSVNLPNLQHLTLTECNGMISGDDLPICSGLETLRINSCKGLRILDGIRCKPQQKVSIQRCQNLESIHSLASDSGTLPPELEFCWNEKLSKGLEVLARDSNGVRLVDVRGCSKIPPAVMLESARACKGTLLLSPVQCCGLAPDGHQMLSLAEQAELRGLAREAIKVKQQELEDKVRNYTEAQQYTEAAEVLSECLRFLRESGAPSDDIDEIQNAILNMRTNIQYKENQSALKGAAKKLKQGGTLLDRFRATAHLVKMLSPRMPSVNHADFISALCDLGFESDEASMFCDYVDCERKGFVTETDLFYIFEGCSPASLKEMNQFYEWNIKHYGSVENGFERLAKLCCYSDGKSLSFLEMEHALREEGWKKPNTRAIFTCLNAENRSGSLTKTEFSILEFFASLQHLEYAEDLVAFLIRKYKTLRNAFKKIDDNNSGAISVEELKEALKGWACKGREGVTGAFRFVDSNHSGIVELWEFENLEQLNASSFIKELRKLQERVYLHWGSFEKAFEHIDGGEGNADGSLSLDEFLHHFANTLRFAEFSKVDPHVLFAFLDADGTGTVTKREFMKLRYFASEAAQRGVKRMRDRLVARFGGQARQAFKRLSENQTQRSEANSKEGSKEIPVVIQKHL